MSMGKGAIMSFSRNQKLNTASSTEAELVGIADALGLIMWVKDFMEAQKYTIDINILFQDKKSTTLLAKNGISLAGKKSKHIKNRYFLITDKVQPGDLEIQHKPTGEMLANYESKPTQGTLFRRHREELTKFTLN